MFLKLSEHSLRLLLLSARAGEHRLGDIVEQRHIHILR